MVGDANSKTPIKPIVIKIIRMFSSCIFNHLRLQTKQLLLVAAFKPAPNQKQSQNEHESTSFCKCYGEPEGVLTGNYSGLFGVLSGIRDFLCNWEYAVCLGCGCVEISSSERVLCLSQDACGNI